MPEAVAGEGRAVHAGLLEQPLGARRVGLDALPRFEHVGERQARRGEASIAGGLEQARRVARILGADPEALLVTRAEERAGRRTVAST